MFKLPFILFICSLLFSCFVDSTKFNQNIRYSIGNDFNKHYQRGFNRYGSRIITWHNKSWEFKKYKWIETIKQLTNNQTRYQYQNPHSECLVTFIVNDKGIVEGAWTEGIDCGS